MKKIINNKGITLIALVITIIVLLLLAGISISMLSGQDGILTKASEAKKKTEQKSTLEQVKLVAMDALMRGDDLTSIEDVEHLNEALKSQGLSETTVDKNEDETVPYPYTINTENNKIYKVALNGTVKEKSIVTDITEKNYGDVITGYSINGVNDWKVFLNDGENVWIIASDYVVVDNETLTKTNMTNTSEGCKLTCTWWYEMWGR